VNHGGGQITNAQFFQIYWNGTVASARGTSLGWQSLQAEIDAFVQNFSNGTPYSSASTAGDYTVVTQYGSGTTPISVTFSSAGAYVDSQLAAKSISDSKIQSYLAGFFQRNLAVPSSSVIYGIYFPSGMKISLQGGTSCSAFCGYHGHFNYNGTDVKYAVFPYTDCRACSMPGKAVADILTMVTSHEIREAVTDPDLNAWYDAAGYEADDKCAWHNVYQMQRAASNNFWVQPEYSNGGNGYPGPGCVVP
jgi:hypothetical protein